MHSVYPPESRGIGPVCRLLRRDGTLFYRMWAGIKHRGIGRMAWKKKKQPQNL